jgi:hypothetical protein
MSYRDAEALDIQRKANNIQQWDPTLKALNLPTPALIEGEPIHNQRKRIMNMVRPFVSDDLQNVKPDHVFESALDDYERRFQESAAREAVRPSRVPEGQLKQVTRHDPSGRPFYEFWGSPRAWLSDFSTGTRRRLVGIRTVTETGYRPGNLG